MICKYNQMVYRGSQHFAWINSEVFQSSESLAALKNRPSLVNKGEIVGINNVVLVVLYCNSPYCNGLGLSTRVLLVLGLDYL